ncbi:MAG TPA: recombination protein RecR [Candidatus Onthoplasma faecigallinarum]|nr:recombination protein RecR [Candidatus Onthoplasma faecigallinarum]
MAQIDSLERLINEFTKLPSVGKKTAQRYAYFLLTMKDEDVKDFADAMVSAKENIHYCKVCANFTDKEICDVCSRPNKEPIICVVKEPKDVTALEKVKDFKGSYHVLHGVINPLEGKGPNDINIRSLLDRVRNEHIQEVIVATNPDVEGEATAMYIANLLKPLGVKVSRLAQGMAMGSELEYTDSITLSKALSSRREM